jgi:putative ABC transport system permease protein
MTVVSVAVSMSLVMAGLALLDLCLFGELVSQTVMIVAIVVIVFAGLLTAVVIYTLTNINISERVRELATLKVLGYYENEVTTYIYREIYIDTLVGIIFGYPLSLAIMQMVFSVMAVGSIGGVSWFMWLIAPLIVFVFTFIVSFILSFKIVKIDMNDSLKAIE